MRVERIIFVISASAFEVIHANVVERRLVQVLFLLEIEYISEVSCWNTAVLKTF